MRLWCRLFGHKPVVVQCPKPEPHLEVLCVRCGKRAAKGPPLRVRK